MSSGWTLEEKNVWKYFRNFENICIEQFLQIFIFVIVVAEYDVKNTSKFPSRY